MNCCIDLKAFLRICGVYCASHVVAKVFSGYVYAIFNNVMTTKCNCLYVSYLPLPLQVRPIRDGLVLLT